MESARGPRRGVQVMVLSVCGGFPLFNEALAVANIGQALSIAMMLPAMRLLTKRDVGRLLLIELGIVLSPVYLAYAGGVTPKYDQVVFFALAAWQVTIAIRLGPHLGDIRKLVRWPVNLATAVVLIAAAYDYLTTDRSFLNMFFQDKSHAAVTAYCLAFLVMWVNRSPLRFLVAIAIYGASLATASRLVAMGAPFFLAAALFEYQRSRRLATTPIGVYLHHVALLIVPVVALRVATSNLAAALTERLGRVSEEASTIAHLELIRLAWELKWSDSVMFLMGAGPGNFGPGLLYEQIPIWGLAAVDPKATVALNEGFVPIHSANLSLLTEFPIWVFVAFVALWWWVLRGLWRSRERSLAMLGLGLVAVTMFYSSHNEFFYVAILALLAAMAASGGGGGYGSIRDESHPRNALRGSSTEVHEAEAESRVGRAAQNRRRACHGHDANAPALGGSVRQGEDAVAVGSHGESLTARKLPPRAVPFQRVRDHRNRSL